MQPKHHHFICWNILLFFLCGCYRYDPPKEDPLLIINAPSLYINTVIDKSVIEPIAVFYHYRVPLSVQGMLRNFVNNISEPGTAFNQICQHKKQSALHSITRFFYNSIWGLFGIFDPASRKGLLRETASFDDTLSGMGLPPGPYLVVPVLGPSYARKSCANIIDFILNPGIILGYNDPAIIAQRGITIRSDNLASFRQIYAVSPNFLSLYNEVKNITLQTASGKTASQDLDDSLNDDIF
ncbi:MAG: MlaA family lipoprotein [Alphaproteobacteria bacterium]|nr:MlaA family lipoprotein [Alphaproteobacteria bacterium]